MKMARYILLILLCCSSAFFATAKNTGNKGEPSINGSVNDADSKKPVQGVTVSITGKGQEKKELITDASGSFKTNQLNPGEVTLLFEKKGYRTFKKEGVVVREGTTLKLTIEIDEADEDDAGLFHTLLRMMDGL